jgi:glycosyltransferase involved in cell wall biosynthesis
MTLAVSVVIPTYNYGRFIAGTLDSVLAQTFQDLEVVVVDDGSADDTVAVVKPYQRDSRVRYFRTANQGPAAARNTGIRLAKAPLVAFLDADDLWLPTKLECQVERFWSNPDLGLVYSRRLLIDEDGCRLVYNQPPLHRGWVLPKLFRTNFVCFSSSVVRRCLFDEIGLFDEQLTQSEDYDLLLRLALSRPFDYVDEPLVLYRTGHAFQATRRTEERLTTVTRIMRRFLAQQASRALLDPAEVRQAWAETWFHIGLARRDRSRLAALPAYIYALCLSPGFAPAWKGLASLLLPEGGRRLLRRACGRPPDWRLRLRLPDPQAAAK